MAEFERALRCGAEAMGLTLPDAGVERLIEHQRLLVKWSRRVNLTTVLEPEAMAERLYLDSAVLVPHLAQATRLHDVGSGAGFPGLVIKALLPAVHVTLTEARRKKVHFLKAAAREMRIADGLDIRERRIVAGGEPEEGLWDEVVSRAAFPPKTWLEVGSPMVGPGGRLWIFSGQPHGEQEECDRGQVLEARFPDGFVREAEVDYRLPFTGRKRWLLSFRRE